MSHFRRCYFPGGSLFITVVTERRTEILGNDLARDLLRAAFRDCLERWPRFRVDAMVMLRDHLHAIFWTLPPDDCDYSKRWGRHQETFYSILARTWWAGTTPHGFASPFSAARNMATAILGTCLAG